MRLTIYTKNSLILFIQIIFLFVFINQSFSQSVDVGFNLTTAYSFNNEVEEYITPFNPRFKTSKIVSGGAFIKYKPINKIAINLGLLLGNEKMNYSYRDMNALEQANMDEVDGNEYSELINRRIYESPSLLFVEIPIEMCFYVKNNLFISGGLIAKYQMNKLVMLPFDTYASLGFGASYKKWGWKIYTESTIKDRKFRMEENLYTINNPNWGLEFKSRSINFSLNYYLWSKQ